MKSYKNIVYKKFTSLWSVFVLAILMTTTYELFGSSEKVSKGRADVYMKALTMTGRKEKLEKVIKEQLELKNGVARLQKMAKYASDAGLHNVLKDIYKRLLELDPSVAVLKELSRLSYNEGSYSNSKVFLDRIEEMNGLDFETNYLLGQIYRRNEEIIRAHDYFDQALELFEQIKNPEVTEYEYYAYILYLKDKPDEAVAVYDRLMKDNPSSVYIKMDYIEFLLDANMIDRAEYYLTELSFYEQLTNDPSKLFPDINREREDIKLRAVLIMIYLYGERGYLSRAYTLIDLLKVHFPKEYRVYAAEAFICSVKDSWREELIALTRAKDMVPFNEDIGENERFLRKQHSSNINYKAVLKLSTDSRREFISTEGGEYRINDTLLVGAKYSSDYLRAKEITKLNGKLNHVSRLYHMTELYTLADFSQGSSLRMSYYISNDYSPENDSGVGGEFSHIDNWGKSAVELAYRKPYWDIPEGVVNGAGVNQLKLSRIVLLPENFTVEGGLSLNQYSLSDAANVAESLGVTAAFRHKIHETEIQKKILGKNAFFSLNFEFDKESVSRNEERVDGIGDSYMPLPIVDREVYSAYLLIHKDFLDNLSGEVYGGYAMDRLGEKSKGPIFGGAMNYTYKDKMSLGVDISHAIAETESTYYSLIFKWNF